MSLSNRLKEKAPKAPQQRGSSREDSRLNVIGRLSLAMIQALYVATNLYSEQYKIRRQ